MFALLRTVGRSPISALHRRLLTHPSPSPSLKPRSHSFTKSPPLPNTALVKPLQQQAFAAPPKTFLSIGLVSGGLGALAGLGGSLISIPLLLRYTPLTTHIAAGTSLLAVLGTTTAATITHVTTSDSIPLRPAFVLGISAALAAPVGAYFAPYLPVHILRRLLGATLIAVSPLPLVRSKLHSLFDIDDPEPLWIGGGMLAGLFSGLLGISGGATITPLIAITMPGLDFRDVVGTCFAALVPSAAAGCAVYLWRRLVDLSAVPFLLVGGATGGFLGSKIVVEAPPEVIQSGLAVVFAGLGFRMLRSPIKPFDNAKKAKEVIDKIKNSAGPR